MNQIHIDRLASGQTTKFRPVGNSMLPLIQSGQEITVLPVKRPLVAGDVVFCRVRGSNLVHLVKSMDGSGRALISNAKGRENGWASKIYGIVDLKLSAK